MSQVVLDDKGAVEAAPNSGDVAMEIVNNALVLQANGGGTQTFSGNNSGDETTTTIGALINGATDKATPADADYVGLMDSAASNVLKKLSWANIKATLKTYFDTLYQATSAKLGRVQIQNDLTEHSGDGALATSGVNLVTGGTGIAGLTLAAPAAGDRCEIRLVSISSGTVVVTTAASVTLNGTDNTATFDAADDVLVLIYHSANRWQIVENVGAVALSTVP